MAGHLHKKLPPGGKLIVCEIVEATLKRFLEQNPSVETAANPKEIAEKCVREIHPSLSSCRSEIDNIILLTGYHYYHGPRGETCEASVFR